MKTGYKYGGRLTLHKARGSVLANLKKRFDPGPVDWAPWMAQPKVFIEQPRK